jgi:hypothetical protein
MPAPVFYPPLTSLLPLDALPEALGFAKDGLTSLLDDLYFKDFQHGGSPRGDAAQYALTVVTLKPLEIEVPGTGIFLVLNPGHGTAPGSVSEFPVTLRYQWPILAWVRAFDPATFSFQPGDFFQLALTVLGFSERQLLDRALGVFVDAPSPIDRFTDDVNAFYGTAIPHPTGADPLGEVLAAIEADPDLEDASVVIFAVYILDNLDLDGTRERLDAFFGSLFGGSVEDWFLRQITPRVDATLKIGAGVKFPRSVLVPLTAVGGTPLPEPAQSLLTFDAGSFFFSTERGIGYDETLTAALTPSQIGSTGFEIAITGARLDLSRTTNIPEATADGRPDDFVGVYVEEALVKLPSFFNQDDGASTARLAGRKLLVGTGGLSGTIALEAVDPNDTTPALLAGRFGAGFELGLSAVSVTFRQNAVTASEIRGFMKIPGFKDAEGNPAEVQIAASIGTDGEFSVTASEEQGLRLLKIPDVLDVEVKSLSVGRKGGRFFVAVAGKIDFADQGGAIGKFIPDKIEIQKLLVWEDGQLELEGGGLALPTTTSLKVGPVAINITAIHFGTHQQEHGGQQRKYAFFGFDGGLSVSPGGVDARGDGIKFYFTTDTGPGKPLDVFLRIQSIKLDLVIPGSAKPKEAALLLSGYLSMKDGAGGGTEYIGGVAFSLPKLRMAGSAAMRYDPRLPSFVIDAGLELASPIVLGATGLGIYGFRGLVGMRYVAKKSAAGLPDDAQWWQYYKAKVPPDSREGIQVSKLAAEEGFSLGAGVSLATVPDAGRAFSSKLFFLLSLPEVFLLQGQGQVLKQRIGLDTTKDPPFFAMIAITTSSVEAAFGVNYKMPEDSGKIAQIDGLLEMGFFWGNAGAWYINIGRDQPEDRRVRARLLTLFNCYFYLLLSSGEIRVGAGASYELKKKLGPFRVELKAYLDLAGRISFKPLQVGGSLDLGGSLGLYIFGCGFTISASASLTAEAPRPFTVSGKLEACVKVLWKKKCVTVQLTWTFSSALDYSEVELFGPEPQKAVQAVNILTQQAFPVYAAKTAALPSVAALSSYVVPVDSYLDIELRQGVKPTGPHPSLAKFEAMGGAPEFTALVPPQKGKSSQVRHEFYLDSVEVLSWNPAASAWQPYDPYAAATPLQLAPFVTADLSTLPWGYWQKTHPSLHNKLRVLARTPFSYLRPGTFPPPPEDLGVETDDVLCAPEERTPQCRDFSAALAPGEESRKVTAGWWGSMPDVLYRTSRDAAIRRVPGHEPANALCVDQDTELRLFLPEPSLQVRLLLGTEAEAVEVTWFARVETKDPGGLTAYLWEPVRQDLVLAADLVKPVAYDDPERPVLRVEVRTVGCSGERARPKEGVAGGLPVHCGDAGRDAEALLAFLDRLAAKGHLAAPSLSLAPELRRVYEGVFFNSPLYRPEEEPERVDYEAVWDRERGPLLVRIRDFQGFDCQIRLSGLEPGGHVPFGEVAGFLEIRPDPEGETGEVFGFVALAKLRSGAEVWVRGRSCWPVGECHAGCRTCLYRVCWLTVEDAIYNDSLPSPAEVQEAADALVEALSGSIQPVWRPDTYFALRLATRDVALRHDDNVQGASHANTWTVGFRTTGPLGHFHRWPLPGGGEATLAAYAALQAAGREDEFRLASLQPYLDLPRCYPNADGRLTNAKPLFYLNPRLGLFYTEAYVYEMFRDWDAYNGAEKVWSSLEVEIRDPAPPPAAPAPAPSLGWNALPAVALAPEVRVVNGMIAAGQPCADMDPAEPLDVQTTVTVTALEPRKLYSALFRARFRRDSAAQPSVREVHRYVFQTSRYPDFAAQVGSWALKKDSSGNVVEAAVYEVEVEAGAAALADAATLLADPAAGSDDLKQRFADPFDRLVDGILGLGALPPAVTTEFNVLRLAGTGRVLGILVRNPEPFNDPKLPQATLEGTLTLAVAGGSTGIFRGVHARDAAQVFVTNADHSLSVPAGVHRFTFQYRRWDGSTWATEATATAEFQRS